MKTPLEFLPHLRHSARRSKILLRLISYNLSCIFQIGIPLNRIDVLTSIDGVTFAEARLPTLCSEDIMFTKHQSSIFPIDMKLAFANREAELRALDTAAKQGGLLVVYGRRHVGWLSDGSEKEDK